jgi:hypothetical protein
LDGEDEERDNNNGKSFGEHWGWFATLYQLAETNALSITGDNSITDLNLLFALNYLEIQKDYNGEIEKEKTKQLQQSRARARY